MAKTTEVIDINDEELAGLSEAERKALLDDPDDTTGDDPPAGKDDDQAGADAAGKAADKDTEPGKAAEADKDVETGKAAEVDKVIKDDTDKGTVDAGGDDSDKGKPGADDQVKADKGKDDDGSPPAVPETFTPQYRAEAVENYDEKMEGLTEKKTALKTQYDDGDITISELLEGRDEIEKEARTLENQQTKAEMAQEQSHQAGEQRWQWEIDRFFASEANSAYKDNPMLESALDTAVKTLSTDEGNKDKSMAWYLEEADRKVRALFNNAAEPTPPKDKDNKPNPDKETGKKPSLGKIPPNLGDLPAADIVDTGGDEFAKLDKLSGIPLEQALAKLTPEEEARYLKG